ncbi:MAG: hypothetical protein ABL907_05135 [Hyphomicrobium sp.]
MSGWRRAIATMLLLIFAPASVLAAIPSEMCVGADGHRVIESVFAPKHHQSLTNGNTQQRGQSWTSQDTLPSGAVIAVVSDLGCFDVQLQVVNLFLPRKQYNSSALAGPIASGAAIRSSPQSSVVYALCGSMVPQHHAQGGVEHDPGLAVRATTVLRN